MNLEEYHQQVIEYYDTTENSYIDGWDLNNSLALHYGYWDEQVNSFPESLLRMNEIMMEAAKISSTDFVLDAGCGIGGSSMYLAQKIKCNVVGISLSKKQIEKANLLAQKKSVSELAKFEVMNFCFTTFSNNSFDAIIACESVCQAFDKELFLKEAFRILKPGGRLVVVDAFLTDFKNNEHPYILKWLQGWKVNFLESSERFKKFLQASNFENITYKNISKYTQHSSKRLNKIYYLASIYLLWKKFTFSKTVTELQKKNIIACRCQYLGLKKGLWNHGIFVATKAH